MTTPKAITLAALMALMAVPASAGLMHEVATEPSGPVDVVVHEPEPKGYGALVTSEADGGSPALIDSMSIVAYPDAERPTSDRGQ